MDLLRNTEGVTWGVQQHLDSTPQNKFWVDHIAEEDAKTNAKHIPEGYPDVYVNGEDVTVTVDPIKNNYWIMHKGYRHAYAQARGALKDHAGVIRVQHYIDKHHEASAPNFLPTSTHIDALDKFTSKCVRNSTRGDVIPKNPGKLPPISKMLYDNALLDQPDWVIDAEMWRFLDRDDRRFDCTGPCR